MLKRINFLLSTIIPQKLYWHIAGLINPWQAVLEDTKDPETLYGRGKELLNLLEKLKLINKKTRVLDIGCGVGRLEYAIAYDIQYCLGVDVAPSMIKIAKERVRYKNVEFRLVNGKNLAEILGNFNLIFSIIVFQHLSPKTFTRYIEDSFKLLKNNGNLFFQIALSWDKDYKMPPENHPWAIRRYNLDKLKKMLLKIGFIQIKVFDITGNKLEGKPDQVFIAASPKPRTLVRVM
ncbi:class I SAM-dependent methyltransferase [Candidatus Daviesbacteria bacterium]|nr:class I SAM-dependent methyltransferase [Candidatus Daviesbacteria bacterium]